MRASELPNEINRSFWVSPYSLALKFHHLPQHRNVIIIFGMETNDMLWILKCPFVCFMPSSRGSDWLFYIFSGFSNCKFENGTELYVQKDIHTLMYTFTLQRTTVPFFSTSFHIYVAGSVGQETQMGYGPGYRLWAWVKDEMGNRPLSDEIRYVWLPWLPDLCRCFFFFFK